MKALSLDMKNREAKKPVLYQSNDPSRNVLTLNISNHTGGTVTFAAGSKLRIGFANLLSTDEVKAITVNDAGWLCSIEQSARGAAVVLSVRNPLQIEDGSSVTLSVNVPSVSKQPASGNLTLLYTGVTGCSDDQTVLRFFIITPPDGHPVMPLNAGWLADMPPIVNISTDPGHLLSNSLGLFLTNTSRQLLVNASSAGRNPRFLISFPTIPRPEPTDPVPSPGLNALTYDDLAKDIWMRVIGDGISHWSLTPSYGSSNQSLVWELTPTTPGILGSGESVEIMIDHIRTVLPPFTTALHVQILDIPGYDDSILTLHLQKSNPKPGILHFYAEDVNLNLGESVVLSWNTFAIQYLELSYSVDDKTVVKSSDNGDISFLEAAYKLILNKSTTFTLTAYDTTGQCAQKQITVTVNQLEIAMGIQPLALAPGSIAKLTWKVSGSDQDTCLLEPGKIKLPLTGTDFPLNVKETTTYAITAYNSKRTPAYLSAQTTVTVPPVSIVSFTSNPNTPIGAEQPVVLSWNVEYASNVSLTPSVGLDPPVDTHPLQPVDSRTVKLSNSTSYTLSATGINGPVQAKVDVQVKKVEIVHFSCEPRDPLPGMSYTLSWDTRWADSVTLDGHPCDASGYKKIYPWGPISSHSHTLVCNGYPGPIEASVYISYGPFKEE